MLPEEDLDNCQEVAMRSMSHGTGLLLYINGYLYRGDAAFTVTAGVPVSVVLSRETPLNAEVFLVSLNMGKLRRMMKVEGKEAEWSLVPSEDDTISSWGMAVV